MGWLCPCDAHHCEITSTTVQGGPATHAGVPIAQQWIDANDNGAQRLEDLSQWWTVFTTWLETLIVGARGNLTFARRLPRVAGPAQLGLPRGNSSPTQTMEGSFSRTPSAVNRQQPGRSGLRSTLRANGTTDSARLGTRFLGRFAAIEAGTATSTPGRGLRRTCHLIGHVANNTQMRTLQERIKFANDNVS